MEEHRAELALFDAAYRYLSELKAGGEALAPKAWQKEAADLRKQRNTLYYKMQSMRDEIKTLETLRKTVDRMTKDEQKRDKEMTIG